MNLHLKDKIIIVTDGARGIGKTIVQQLAAEKAFPVIIGPDETENLQALASIHDNGAQITSAIENSSDCEKIMQEILQRFERIDGLINYTDSQTTDSAPDTGLMTTLHRDLSSCYLLTQAAFPALKKSRGAMINVVSGAGGNDLPADAAINGGRLSLTREWAVDLLKYEIRVNAVIAGKDEKRPATMTEVADTVIFLLSSVSSHTTGQWVYVNGGIPIVQ